MDLGTIVGAVMGLVLVLGSVVIGGSSLGTFVSVPSILVTLGGSGAALLIAYPMGKIKGVLAVTRKTLNAGDLSLAPWYESIIEIATVARRDGLLALEDRIPGLENDFLKRGLQMALDGTPAEAVEQIMSLEINELEDRHVVGHSMFKDLATYCPAFGMIGTLIGLVAMLQNLEDPSQIGAGMALALLTTLYGAFFANLFFTPMQGKLEQRTAEETKQKKMLLTAIISIQAGDSPRIVGEKLKVFLSPAERAAIDSAE